MATMVTLVIGVSNAAFSFVLREVALAYIDSTPAAEPRYMINVERWVETGTAEAVVGLGGTTLTDGSSASLDGTIFFKIVLHLPGRRRDEVVWSRYVSGEDKWVV